MAYTNNFNFIKAIIKGRLKREKRTVDAFYKYK